MSRSRNVPGRSGPTIRPMPLCTTGRSTYSGLQRWSACAWSAAALGAFVVKCSGSCTGLSSQLVAGR